MLPIWQGLLSAGQMPASSFLGKLTKGNVGRVIFWTFVDQSLSVQEVLLNLTSRNQASQSLLHGLWEAIPRRCW
jgi:hypothetical protein